MNSTEDNIEIIQLQAASEIVYGPIGLVIFVMGTIGNLINIISFSRLESLNTLASSLFLFASFIGSQTVLTAGLLTRVIQGLTGVDLLFISLFICKARWMLRTASGTFSLTCVCLAAIDRYLLSCHNVRRHRLITLRRARWMILISACFWLLVFSPYAVFYTTNRSSCAIVNSTFAYFASYFNLFNYSLIPLSVLSIFSALTWHNLGGQPTTYLRGGIRLYDQVTRMIIAQILVILITSFPNMIWQIYTVSTSTITKTALRVAQENLINSVCVVIGFVTHAVTFYVYLIASPVFRKNVQSIIFSVRRISPLKDIEIDKI